MKSASSMSFPNFGAARMGAPMNAFVRVDSKPIRLRSQVYEPDYVIVVDPTLMRGFNCFSGLKENGVAIINGKEDTEAPKMKAKQKGVIDKMVLFRGYVFIGLLNAVLIITEYYLALFQGGWKSGMQLEPNDMTFADPLHLKAMTMVYVGIVVLQIANVFSCRSERYSAFKFGFLSNKLILLGIIFELILVCFIIYTPFFQKIFQTTGLGLKEWGILFVFMVVIFSLEELRKKIWKTIPLAHRSQIAQNRDGQVQPEVAGE